MESLIRLSEALARVRFSELVSISFDCHWKSGFVMNRIYELVYLQVEKHDVTEAFRLLEVAMQQSATDHSTGNSLLALPLNPNFIFLARETYSNDVFSFLQELSTWISLLLEFQLAKG